MKIEIGCGKKQRTGYLTCDIRKLPNVDYVCHADNLPFENEQIDEVYSRHVVEHFTLKEFLKVLEEWNRVLKVNGEIYIICPNLLWHLEQILQGEHKSFYNKKSGENDRYWGFGSLFGWQQDQFDVHKFGYYFELMKDILEEFGFDNVEDLTNSGKGLENEPWHLEIRAKKKRKSPKHTEVKWYTHFDVKH
ncbi:MAG: class I SAM-dependent methyltransferase [Cytophagaceae bacterium]